MIKEVLTMKDRKERDGGDDNDDEHDDDCKNVYGNVLQALRAQPVPKGKERHAWRNQSESQFSVQKNFR